MSAHKTHLLSNLAVVTRSVTSSVTVVAIGIGGGGDRQLGDLDRTATSHRLAVRLLPQMLEERRRLTSVVLVGLLHGLRAGAGDERALPAREVRHVALVPPCGRVAQARVHVGGRLRQGAQPLRCIHLVCSRVSCSDNNVDDPPATA